MRTLARQLLAMEAAAEGRKGAGGAAKRGERKDRAGLESVCEKLRVELTQFAGADGFASLLRRALAMAREDVHALGRIKIGSGGFLEGLDGLEQTEMEAGAIAITANLLDLLAKFIGETFTLKLVRKAWPELPPLPLHPTGTPGLSGPPLPPSDAQTEARPQ
jgi:hypothetical protein